MKTYKYLDLLHQYRLTPDDKKLQFFKIALEQVYHQGRVDMKELKKEELICFDCKEPIESGSTFIQRTFHSSCEYFRLNEGKKDRLE